MESQMTDARQRKTIRVHFADYYGMKPESTWAYRILSRHYDVRLDSVRPDYLIDGGLGMAHLDYPNAIRIVIIGESYVPDFNQFDYAVGFDHLTFGDRYLRIPLYAHYWILVGDLGCFGGKLGQGGAVKRGSGKRGIENALDERVKRD